MVESRQQRASMQLIQHVKEVKETQKIHEILQSHIRIINIDGISSNDGYSSSTSHLPRNVVSNVTRREQDSQIIVSM